MKKTTFNNLEKEQITEREKSQDFAGKKDALKAALGKLANHLEKNKINTTPTFKQDMVMFLEMLTTRKPNNDIINQCKIGIQLDIDKIKFNNPYDATLLKYLEELEKAFSDIKNFPLFPSELTRRKSANNLFLPSATLGIHNRQTRSAPVDSGYASITDEELTELWRQRYTSNISLGQSLEEEEKAASPCNKVANYFKSWFGG